MKYKDTTFGSGNPQAAVAGSYGSVLQKPCSLHACPVVGLGILTTTAKSPQTG